MPEWLGNTDWVAAAIAVVIGVPALVFAVLAWRGQRQG
jgi:hypothetical protein